jgi:hypothetical protein
MNPAKPGAIARANIVVQMINRLIRLPPLNKTPLLTNYSHGRYLHLSLTFLAVKAQSSTIGFVQKKTRLDLT